VTIFIVTYDNIGHFFVNMLQEVYTVHIVDIYLQKNGLQCIVCVVLDCFLDGFSRLYGILLSIYIVFLAF